MKDANCNNIVIEQVHIQEYLEGWLNQCDPTLTGYYWRENKMCTTFDTDQPQ